MSAPKLDTEVSWKADQFGESVELSVPESTGLTAAIVITLPAALVESMHLALRATQLGVTGGGDL